MHERARLGSAGCTVVVNVAQRLYLWQPAQRGIVDWVGDGRRESRQEVADHTHGADTSTADGGEQGEGDHSEPRRRVPTMLVKVAGGRTCLFR
jgi:hypothetical protein